jgi:hypothetical protein
MKLSKLLLSIASILAVLSLIAPQSAMADTQPAASVMDVGLAPNGVLHGRFVNEQGVGWTQATVLVRNERTGEVYTTVTDADGRFVVQGLLGGVYSVVAGNSTSVLRLWPGQSAPPNSQSGVLIVSNDQIVRGQMGRGGRYLLLGGIAAAVVTPVIFMGNSAS